MQIKLHPARSTKINTSLQIVLNAKAMEGKNRKVPVPTNSRVKHLLRVKSVTGVVVNRELTQEALRPVGS